MAPVLPLTPANIRRAAEALRAGELVAFPTETVYGLGADATDDRAVAAIFEAKGRPRFNPLISHVPDIQAARRIVELGPRAERLAAEFWPGALSLVAKRRGNCGLSRLVSAGLPTAAVRVPAHEGARELLRAAGTPIAAPSANPSGAISPTTARHVADAFGGRIAIILDGGPCGVGLESTVVDVSSDTPILLRAGGVTVEALEAALGMKLGEPENDDVSPKSPGMQRSHYAPSRPLRMNAHAARPGEALLGFGPARDTAFNLSPSGDVTEAAANLFRALHLLDAPPWTGIAVMPIPEHGLGRAINDRLRRAAAGRTDVEPTLRSPHQSNRFNGIVKFGRQAEMYGRDDSSARAAALDCIRQAVGPRGWTDDADTMAPFLADEREMFPGGCALVARPSSTAEVAEIVGICAEAGIPIVPQGGNTGLVGAGLPRPADDAVLISLGRMNRIRDIDPLDYTITVEAGCILANIQKAAADADRLFPLSLGSEGTCQIGGNLSTNAGGINVLRYGNARELVLGLEVVLPDGRIWNGLKRLRKDNTGYDLKQLYIGGEGTLGVITAAVCKLFPRPRDVRTAMVGLRDLDSALVLLARARDASGDRVTSFELICRDPYAAAVAHIPGVRDPLESEHDAYVLFELTGASAHSGMETAMEATLAEAFDADEITDAAVAQSQAQRADFWRLREAVVEAQKFEGRSFKHDVSVAVSRVPAFIRRANAAVGEIVPGARPFAFGHCGDGNIHYNVSQPRGMDNDVFLAMRAPVTAAVYDIIVDMGGSFSAEHGVGQLKLGEMARYKNPLELDMMRRVKAALDPGGIMNPGKML